MRLASSSALRTGTVTGMHALLSALLAAARGRFPDVDGGVTFVPPHREGIGAIVAFTGHAFVMTDLGPADFSDIELNGFGLAHRPEAQLRLARGGRIGVIDATTVWLPGRDVPSGEVAAVEERDASGDHPRVRHALAIRTEVRVFEGPEGLITIASGLAGRQEMSVEASRPGEGSGRRLIKAAKLLADPERPLFAAVAPGNTRSFRAFQAEGFSVVASELVVEIGA